MAEIVQLTGHDIDKRPPVIGICLQEFFVFISVESTENVMATYMTQKMSSGVLQATTYYRVQSAHPTHGESVAFTLAAKTDYATVHNINAAEVEVGTYKSGQGVPTGGNTKQI